MTLLQALLFGIVQGLTEFLPISSSGHLLFAHHFLDVEEYGLQFDVALHIGTLLALLIVFKKDVAELAAALFRKSSQTRVAWLVLLATVPAVAAGILLQEFAESSFRSPYLVSVTLIIVAILMLLAERLARHHDGIDIPQMSRAQALVIGSAQAIALIPGVSRSGSTITAGLFAGLNRVSATKFSFLLSIPITFGAIIKVLADQTVHNQIGQEPLIFIVGIASAFISGLLAIKFLLRFVAKHSLDIFAYYRILLGALVLAALFFA